MPHLSRLLPVVFACASTACLAQGMTLAVNAGISTQDHPQTVADNYRPLAEAATRNIKGELKIVALLSSRVNETIKTQGHPVMVVHTHHAALAVQSAGYQVVALSSDEVDDQAYVMVMQNSPYRSLRDLSKVKVSLGGRDSFATAMIRGALREQGVKLDDMNVMYTRFQDGVPFYVKNGFVEAGGTRLKRDAAEWAKDGGRVLFEGPRLPVFAVIALPSIDQPTRAGLQRTFVELKDSPGGRAMLTRLRMNGFVRPAPEQFTKLAEWLGYGRVPGDAILALQ